MTDTIANPLTRRDVAHLAREFGKTADLDGFGSRGRVSENLVLQYLTSLPAKSVRQIAGDLGVAIPEKGKISEAELLSVTGAVAKNAPKASE
jgi:hypothetical protein